MNSLNGNEYLQLGQQLSIGNKNIHRNIESKKRTILYSVKQGDNLYKISELFDVTIKSIEEINNFNESTLMPGQIIKIAIRAFNYQMFLDQEHLLDRLQRNLKQIE